MDLTKALSVDRKRRRQGKFWPMPIRETDLGHIYTEVTIKPLAASRKQWTGPLLVDTGATDTFVPASILRKLGIKAEGKRSYELADGSWQELEIGFGVIEIQGQRAGGTLVFAGEEKEPLLGVTVLESTGFWTDPQKERLISRPPKRKARQSLGRGSFSKSAQYGPAIV